MTISPSVVAPTFGAFDPWRATLRIGGEWCDPAQPGDCTEVIDPATGRTMGSVPTGSAADVDAAVAAAQAAFGAWSTTPVERRAEVLAMLADGLRRRRHELAAVISAEMGAPLDNAGDVQVGLAIDVVDSYAAIARAFDWESGSGRTLLRYEPVGVVGAITPWNYPLYLAVLKVAPALAAGCTVVLKPSGDAPLDAFLLAEVLDEVCARTGAPPGIVNVVTGDGATIGGRLATHPDIDMISFTGSTATGRQVSALAAGTVKRVALELGGKSAAIVLDDVADLKSTLTAAVGNVFYNSGQTCTACTRILVPDAQYERAVSIAADIAERTTLDDPSLPGPHLGPLANRRQYESVLRHIDAAVARGARLVTGGRPAPADVPAGFESGCWIRPTVFADVPADAEILREEVFGPVAALVRYRDVDDAVRIANDSIYGLAGAVWSGSKERALAVARRLRTGRVELNGAGFDVTAPVGGYKQSGNGRELGLAGLIEYLEVKAIVGAGPAAVGGIQ